MLFFTLFACLGEEWQYWCNKLSADFIVPAFGREGKIIDSVPDTQGTLFSDTYIFFVADIVCGAKVQFMQWSKNYKYDVSRECFRTC